jgi:hypothetical protein
MKDTMTLLPDIRLDFNIMHPPLDECYMDGYACAAAELEETENPFPRGSIEESYWLDGWSDAYAGEAPLFDANSLPAEEPLVNPLYAVNDDQFVGSNSNKFLLHVLEITGALVVSAIIGYQLIELVA